MTIMKETHVSHPEHELELKNYQKPYTCDGCKEKGFGSRYRCELCDFDLHQDCMFTTPTTSHQFFKKSRFKFFDQPRPGCSKSNCDECRRYCDACGKAIYGFVYHSEADGWDLHPCCRNLKHKLNLDGVKFWLVSEKASSKCIWCNKKVLRDSNSSIPGWSYVSKCEKYRFHVYCATEMVIEGWKNGANSDNCLALENLDLPLHVNSKRNGGRVRKYWRIVRIFLKTIACILLGDPTITLACLLLDVASK